MGVLKPKVSAGHRPERHGDGMGDQLTAGPGGERGPGGETLKCPIRAKTRERREGGAGRALRVMTLVMALRSPDMVTMTMTRWR